MEKIIYGSKMKKVDSYAIENIGIPSMVLMERAAFSAFSHINRYADLPKKCVSLCGVGNNGGDGLALARMSHLDGDDVHVFVIGDEAKATEQWKQQKRMAINCGVTIDYIEVKGVTEEATDAYSNVRGALELLDKAIDDCHYVVDAIFGIGLSREVQGIYAEVINMVNEKKKKRKLERFLFLYSLDVPSGLCADTGRVMGTAIKADTTYTFGAVKTGLLLCDGRDYSGKIHICDIGFPKKIYAEALEKQDICMSLNHDDICEAFYRRRHSNKGTYGKVLVIGGSENVYGAAYFAAMSAYRSGCGLVRLITHKNNRDLIYEKMPEAIINVYDSGEEEENIAAMVNEAVDWADTIVIGPGLSKGREAQLLMQHTMSLAKEQSKYIIIDADGLNIISDRPELKQYYHEKTIVTPHVGEAARLMKKSVKEIAENIIDNAAEYAHENNINVMLKDSTTVILGIESSDDKCNNRVCVNKKGNSGMATGGCGDVLTGIVAAVLAGSIDIEEIELYRKLCEAGISEKEKERELTFLGMAIAGYVHGDAGDSAADRFGEPSLMASDILDKLSGIFNVL